MDWSSRESKCVNSLFWYSFRSRPHSLARYRAEKLQNFQGVKIKRILDQKNIELDTKKRNGPIVWAAKMDGNLQSFVNYGIPNEATQRHLYSIPRMSLCLVR